MIPNISPEAMKEAASERQILTCAPCDRPTPHTRRLYYGQLWPRCDYCDAAYQADGAGYCEYCPGDGSPCAVCGEEA